MVACRLSCKSLITQQRYDPLPLPGGGGGFITLLQPQQHSMTYPGGGGGPDQTLQE